MRWPLFPEDGEVVYINSWAVNTSSYPVYIRVQFWILKGNSTLKNVGLNEYLREISTSQKSVSVVQRKKIFNDKNHLLIYLLKNYSSSGRTEVVIISIIFLSMLRQRLARQSLFSSLQ